MYIRIQDKTIRFRVSPQEADKLIAGQVLSAFLTLSVNVKLVYQVQMIDDINRFDYNESENKICLSVNREKLISELSNRPSKKGIVFDHVVGEQNLSISLEINLKNR